jgi:uncharacterized membrane protein
VKKIELIVPQVENRQKLGFGQDFRRFFTRGLAALLPTLITIFVLSWLWNQLHDKLGRPITDFLRYGLKWIALQVSDKPAGYINRYWDAAWDALPEWMVQLIGVMLAIVLVYIVGLVIGNLIGRTVYRMAEVGVMRIPLVRAIYPAVKQITDFVLAERQEQFLASKVVAVEPHEKGIWSIALVTGGGLKVLNDATGEEMVTVFVPSSPTAFSGYVMIVPRKSLIELPLTVEEAMRLLVSGGVIAPPEMSTASLSTSS